MPIFVLQIPGLDKSMFGTEYDWQYYTQDNGVTNKANKNNSVYWPRGKMLGGCSNINGMIYFRGNYLDYQRWYDAGNKDWHPNVVSECFKKAESLQDENLAKDKRLKDFYGNNGPLIINSFNSTYRDLTVKVLQSWNEMNIKTVSDLNFENTMGSGITRVTAYNGRRASTEHVYLKPARRRNNLHVITNALVTKVLVNNDTKEVYGVEVEKASQKFQVLAAIEVILSAGAIETPHLLMLSGIGSRPHLELHNISCIVDLPAVGAHLRDHKIVPVTILGDEPGQKDEAQENFDVIKYLYNQTGYLAQNSFSDIAAMFSSNPNAKYPTFQVHLKIFWKQSTDLEKYLNNIARYREVVVNAMLNYNKNSSIYFFQFILLHPHSTGHISLKTGKFKDKPIISYPDDVNANDEAETVAGIKLLTNIVNTTFFKTINGRIGRMSWPECDKFELDSSFYWNCIDKNMRITVYHPIGTARMGRDTTDSVVNSQLKVHFVKKLRVVDASVMPSHISGNINGPVVMIAERASSLIKREHGIEKQSSDQCF